MLKDLIEVAALIQKPVAQGKSLAERKIPVGIVSGLSQHLNGFRSHQFSARFDTPLGSHSILPSQYFVWACQFIDLSKALRDYFKLLSKVKTACEVLGLDPGKVLFGDVDKLKSNLSADLNLTSCFEDTNDLDRFAKFLDNDDDQFRLGGKAIVNHRRDAYIIRPDDDVFGSIILKQLNVPAVHASGFGDLVYALSCDFDIFEQLRNYFLSEDEKANNELLLNGESQTIPKVFLLLAGVSGTGKTRYDREQAARQRTNLSNYLLVPVRPDWHEPSDLLGYVSRIGNENFVATPLLKFIAKAWRNATATATSDDYDLKPLDSITTYWACLDEMNLAPVEQYFADYLAVLETRRWNEGKYSCDSLIHPAAILSSDGNALKLLGTELGFTEEDGLWAYFAKNGIPLPPNLIVAGTVNMDETTHGFSRKVIDRAFTFDFGEFFPNDFDHYFVPDKVEKTLVFPRHSHGNDVDLSGVPADPDGTKSKDFLKAVNTLLKDTPFELAFRALSELLVSVEAFSPADDLTLRAVWDDFLMGKLLPRLEGDAEKLRFDGEKSLLTELAELLRTKLRGDFISRPDLLATMIDGSVFDVPFRSLKKLDWMQ